MGSFGLLRRPPVLVEDFAVDRIVTEGQYRDLALTVDDAGKKASRDVEVAMLAGA